MTAKVGMSKIDGAATSCTGGVRGGTIVVSVLGAETPTTSLPKGALLHSVTRLILTAPEAVWELKLSSLTSLAKYNAFGQAVFSFFYIGWALGGKDMWDPIITGWKEGGRRGRGMSNEEVLLKTSADSARSEASFHSK